MGKIKIFVFCKSLSNESVFCLHLMSHVLLWFNSHWLSSVFCLYLYVLFANICTAIGNVSEFVCTCVFLIFVFFETLLILKTNKQTRDVCVWLIKKKKKKKKKNGVFCLCQKKKKKKKKKK